MNEQVACRAATRDDTSCTPSITIMAAENLEGQVVDYLRAQVAPFSTPSSHKYRY
jgi:DNA polymerase epsilon subunit 1